MMRFVFQRPEATIAAWNGEVRAKQILFPQETREKNDGFTPKLAETDPRSVASGVSAVKEGRHTFGVWRSSRQRIRADARANGIARACKV